MGGFGSLASLDMGKFGGWAIFDVDEFRRGRVCKLASLDVGEFRGGRVWKFGEFGRGRI